MKILIIGSGGREYALAWKLSDNSAVEQIFIAPGNGAMSMLEKVSCVDIYGAEKLVEFAEKNEIDLTLVGSEEMLVDGIVNQFQIRKLPIVGPDKKSAQLEGSKAYAKAFMKQHNIPTAAYCECHSLLELENYLATADYPLVVKADGLMAGKGVWIIQTKDEANTRLKENVMSGNHFVVETYLEGIEVSILAFTDGKTLLPLISAQDHKKIGEGETGLNTGGMGSVAPHPYLKQDELLAIEKQIMMPTLSGIQRDGLLFSGVIFFGVMVTKDGPYLLEYNMRLGDPETQAVLPLMQSDFLELLQCCVKGELDTYRLKWHQGYACCVVLAAEGYPNTYEKGQPISQKGVVSDGQYFYAGVASKEQKLFTNGGRVMNCVGFGLDVQKAREMAYTLVENIEFSGKVYRKDIGSVGGSRNE